MAATAPGAREGLLYLLWGYCALLLLEGALRKWVAPGLADPLLLIRDPVALAIIAVAVRSGFLCLDRSTRALFVLFLAFVGLAGWHLAVGAHSAMVLFGLRTYFLHLPLVFVMARVMEARDIRRALVALLLLSIPVAALMAVQFVSDRTAWINAGAGEDRLQIEASLGRVRPAGPFSFVSGSVQYATLAFAALLSSHIGRLRVSATLQTAAWGAMVVAVGVSGSRSLLLGIVLVMAAAVAALSRHPALLMATGRRAILPVLLILALSSTALVQQGLQVIDRRFEDAGLDEMWERTLRESAQAFQAVWDAPLLGVGLGFGTNVGAALGGVEQFLLGEAEWVRILYEAGPLLGGAYLGWRVWLLMMLTRYAVQAARAGHLIPVLLLASTATNLLNGAWGQPTTLGFAIVGAGLSLAAARVVLEQPSRPQRLAGTAARSMSS